MIDCVIYSYKNKNLPLVVQSLLHSTSNNIFITVFDQNPIDRKSLFDKLEKVSQVSYNHIVWDSIDSPCEKKGDVLNSSNAKYFLIISDDIVMEKGWDEKCISFLANKKAILSGSGKVVINQKDKFSFYQNRLFSETFLENGFIDRNFIFGNTKAMQSGQYPFKMKYYGEEESYSINLYKSNTAIFSAPSDLYSDLGLRTIENNYTPYSKEHNYNIFISDLKSVSEHFLNMHNIDKNSVHKIPYQTNDVEYDPSRLDFQDVDARKFIENVNKIS